MRPMILVALDLVPIQRVPLLYGALGPDQQKVWDQAEIDLEEASATGDSMMLTLGCERYIAVMSEVLEFAERKIQHARIARQLREDCWSAREES